jgi:uncharacterized protein YcaQ
MADRAGEAPVLDRAQVRRLALQAQGLVGRPYPLAPSAAGSASRPRRTAAVVEVLEHLGAVQLDTISVLARSHELVPYARLGAVGRDAVDTAYWGAGSATGSDRALATNERPGGAATAFEYWSHAACVLPADRWPWFAFRRRAIRRRGIRWHDVPTNSLASVLDRLAAEGPLTATELGGAKRGGEWWDWSETKIAVEWLLDVGEVVCSRRLGWRRVYDLPGRALPAEVLAPSATPGARWTDDDGVRGPSDQDCLRHLVLASVATLGVGTTTDVLDVHRLGSGGTQDAARAVLADLAEEGTVVRVEVPGWREAWADPGALAGLARAGGRHRTTLLSPFDSLVWHRGRTERVFGFSHSLEAYTPAHRRVHGYFTMPVLHGGRLVARVDPKRERGTLHARTVTLETSRGPGAEDGRVVAGAAAGIADALAETARWVGAVEVALGEVRPAGARAAVAGALAAALLR